MINGYETQHIVWSGKNKNNNEYFQVAHSSGKHLKKSVCWLWESRYGSEGALKWRNREEGELIVSTNRSILKYTNVMNLFVKLCKNKIRKYKLYNHIILKKEKINKIYTFVFIINKFNINLDVTNHISTFIHSDIIDIKRFLK